MEEFKVELHVHTKETSPCGGVYAKDVVELYQQAGFGAIVITDHFFNGFFESLGDLPWERKVDCYLKGYRAAMKEAELTNLQVFLGMEFRNIETENDFLVFGFDESFLYEHPNLYEKSLPEVFSLCHEAGAMVIQAHPARVRLAIPENGKIKCNMKQPEALQFIKEHPNLPEIPFLIGNKLCRKNNVEAIPAPTLLRVCNLRCPELLDGIESHNANYHWVQNPEEIRKILEEYPHLIGVSASDFHEIGHLAKGGIVLNSRVHTSEELITVLKERQYKMIV